MVFQNLFLNPKHLLSFASSCVQVEVVFVMIWWFIDAFYEPQMLPFFAQIKSIMNPYFT